MNGLFKKVTLWVVLAIIVVLLLTRFSDLNSNPDVFGSTGFATQIEADNIADPVKVSLGENSVQIYAKFKAPVGDAGQRDTTFRVPEFRGEWEAKLNARGVRVEYTLENTALGNMIFQIIVLLLIIGVFWLFMVRRMQRTGDTPESFKSTFDRIRALEYALDSMDKIGRVVMAGLRFDNDTATLKPGSEAGLEGISLYLKAHDNRSFMVVGHTDSATVNGAELSLRRAQAVVEALVRDFEVNPGQLEAHGVGALAPLCSNAKEAGRTKNQRVELVER